MIKTTFLNGAYEDLVTIDLDNLRLNEVNKFYLHVLLVWVPGLALRKSVCDLDCRYYYILINLSLIELDTLGSAITGIIYYSLYF